MAGGYHGCLAARSSAIRLVQNQNCPHEQQGRPLRHGSLAHLRDDPTIATGSPAGEYGEEGRTTGALLSWVLPVGRRSDDNVMLIWCAGSVEFVFATSRSRYPGDPHLEQLRYPQYFDNERCSWFCVFCDVCHALPTYMRYLSAAPSFLCLGDPLLENTPIRLLHL
jgi:hypothetical protein